MKRLASLVKREQSTLESARHPAVDAIKAANGGQDAGYHTEEYRIVGHVMIQVTGSRPLTIGDPPWQAPPQRTSVTSAPPAPPAL